MLELQQFYFKAKIKKKANGVHRTREGMLRASYISDAMTQLETMVRDWDADLISVELCANGDNKELIFKTAVEPSTTPIDNNFNSGWILPTTYATQIDAPTFNILKLEDTM